MLPADNLLFYGDNLDVLRRHIRDESVDLVYLDPPFNSNATYNVLFAAKDGHQAAAQIEAFEDTWTWDESAARQFAETVEAGGRVADVLLAFKRFLGTNDMLAYLAMMAPRLVELRRVLKSTGSLYLHCDPTASHYLKLLLDAVFGPEQFQNEIIWRRTNARSTTGRWPRVHDALLFYTRGDTRTFHPLRVTASEAKMPHTLITWKDGLKYQTFELTAPGRTREGESGKPWRGFAPGEMGRHWGNTHAVMDDWDNRGLIHWAAKGGFPRRRAEEPFVPADRMVVIDDTWTDIDRINQAAKERLGYPTQKPVALLERIIEASSNEGDLVLDPFCGCGTTVEAAQKLGRKWIGIDITSLATALIKRRLRDAFGDMARYKVIGEPTTAEDAAELAASDKYQFQWWALGLVGARPEDQKKGADRGIDGRLNFHDGGEKTRQIIFSVKGGNLKATDLRDLRGVIDREKADIGVLLSFEKATKAMRTEAASAGFYTSPWGQHARLQLFTVAELLSGATIDYPKTAGVNQTYKVAPRAALKVAERMVAEPTRDVFGSLAVPEKVKKPGRDPKPPKPL